MKKEWNDNQKIGCVVWLVLIGFFVIFGITHHDESKDSDTNKETTEASNADAPMVFRTNTQCMAAISKEANHEIVELSSAKDYDGLKEMQNNGELYILQANTKVLVIDGGMLQSKIRVQDGQWKGLDLWIDQSFLTHN